MKSEEHTYLRSRFSAEVVKEAVRVFDQQTNPDGKFEPILNMSVVLEGVERGHDNEDEFFADYRRNPDKVRYIRTFRGTKTLMRVLSAGPTSFNEARVSIKVEAERLPQILAVMAVFEANKQQSLIPVETPKKKEPIVFIGHGHSGAWKLLREHLQDKHGLKIEAYEIGARAGHTIRDVLQAMLDKASIAFLVMTGEDETASGALNPRLNVVHEAGLFQGKLGFNRAIILLETGVNEFSNMHGIEQLRFTNIKEVFGDVLATIRREFPNE